MRQPNDVSRLWGGNLLWVCSDGSYLQLGISTVNVCSLLLYGLVDNTLTLVGTLQAYACALDSLPVKMITVFVCSDFHVSAT